MYFKFSIILNSEDQIMVKVKITDYTVRYKYLDYFNLLNGQLWLRDELYYFVLRHVSILVKVS